MKPSCVAVATLILCFGALVWADPSDDQRVKDAQAKLAAKAASRPASTQPNENIAKLVADLRAQIKELQSQVASEHAKAVALQTELDSYKKNNVTDIKAKDSVDKAIEEMRLIVGMTLEDANKSLKITGKKGGESEIGTEYEWELLGPRPAPRWTAYILDGKITRWAYNGVKFKRASHANMVDYVP